MTPPSTPARVALYAAVAFVLAFGVGAAGATLLQGDSERDAAFEALGPNVAVAWVPVGGGAVGERGRSDLLTAPGARATSVISVALLTQMLAKAGGARKLGPRELSDGTAALARPEDPGATDRLGSHLDGVFEDAAEARTALAKLSGAVATRPLQPYRELGWSAPDQASFLARLAGGCLLGPDDTSIVMSRLPAAATGREQQGQAWTTRRSAVVSLPSGRVAVAIVAVTRDKPSGDRAVSAVAAWVTRYAEAPVTTTPPCA